MITDHICIRREGIFNKLILIPGRLELYRGSHLAECLIHHRWRAWILQSKVEYNAGLRSIAVHYNKIVREILSHFMPKSHCQILLLICVIIMALSVSCSLSSGFNSSNLRLSSFFMVAYCLAL